MNPKERLSTLLHKFLPPKPSAEWLEYLQRVRTNSEENVPVHGLGERVIFDYYGESDKENVEQARIRIPLQGGRLEISYHITRHPDGRFKPVYEGIFPHDGK